MTDKRYYLGFKSSTGWTVVPVTQGLRTMGCRDSQKVLEADLVFALVSVVNSLWICVWDPEMIDPWGDKCS